MSGSNTGKPSVLRSLSDAEFEQLPSIGEERMRSAVERGREARKAAEAAVPHPNVTVNARFK